MKKIIFLDLDGTLWTNEIIPDSALEAIHRAQKNGHKIFVNTGRTKCEAIDTLAPVGLDGYCLSAGTEIIIDHKKINYVPMPEKDVRLILNHLREHHVGCSLEGSYHTFTDYINRQLFLHEFNTKPNSFAQLRFFNCGSIEDMTDIDFKQVMKIYTYNINETPYDQIMENIPSDYEWTTFAGWRGEITTKKYNKATAIQTVSDYFNHEYETVAVGDSENDIPMLKSADISIVMGNGSEDVKKLGDYVTDSIDNDGLYKAFEHYGLL